MHPGCSNYTEDSIDYALLLSSDSIVVDPSWYQQFPLGVGDTLESFSLGCVRVCTPLPLTRGRDLLYDCINILYVLCFLLCTWARPGLCWYYFTEMYIPVPLTAFGHLRILIYFLSFFLCYLIYPFCEICCFGHSRLYNLLVCFSFIQNNQITWVKQRYLLLLERTLYPKVSCAWKEDCSSGKRWKLLTLYNIGSAKT